MTLDEALSQTPLVAILRGVRPSEAEAVCGALVEAGVRAIETPLNSPDPFKSVEIMAKAFAETAAIGAGTVLEPEDAARLRSAGGVFAVAPNTDRTMIDACLHAAIEPMPGFFTPSEAFAALAAGARRLKLFPAAAAGPVALSALKAVLPPGASVYAVGGVSEADAEIWARAGAAFSPSSD